MLLLNGKMDRTFLFGVYNEECELLGGLVFENGFDGDVSVTDKEGNIVRDKAFQELVLGYLRADAAYVEEVME